MRSYYWSLPTGKDYLFLRVILGILPLDIDFFARGQRFSPSTFSRGHSAHRAAATRASARTTMPKRRRDENEEAESSPLADDALEAKILELVRKRGLTKTC